MDKRKLKMVSLNRSSYSSSTPKRPMFVMSKNMNMKKIEAVHDCFILDFNPYHTSRPIIKYSHDISIIAEKGKVACRDYPHSRHLCVRYPLRKTPPSKHCKKCYCCVCDVPAPCKYWSLHCVATKRNDYSSSWDQWMSRMYVHSQR